VVYDAHRRPLVVWGIENDSEERTKGPYGHVTSTLKYKKEKSERTEAKGREQKRKGRGGWGR
jgi:hypothetical protein